MNIFHNLSINSIIKETNSSVSIEFIIPYNLKDDYSFVSGQYVTLEAIIDGEKIRRAYSISSCPESKVLKVVVKEVENGQFSSFANNKLKIGDRIKVSTPEGRFALKTNSSNKNNYLFFAAGSGITPIISMIKNVLLIEPDSSLTLLYGNKKPSETIFYNELNTLNKNFTNFNLHYTFTQDSSSKLFGRIDNSKVNFILKNIDLNSVNDVFLCGPEEMISEVKNSLINKKFNENNIHFELFTLSAKESNDVTKNNSSNSDISKVKVLLDDEEIEVEIPKKDIILDVLLKADIDAPYSCQGGVCSSCICKVEEGEVTMVKNAILTDAEIKEGLVLACQAKSVSDSVKLNFDDV